MNKKALLVGINHFKNFKSATLHGCLTDVKSNLSIVKNIAGFEDKDITVLTEELATKDGIMNKLKGFQEESKKGNLNYLYFSFSSHGTQNPNKEEEDGLDEVLCPHDIREHGGSFDEHSAIIDDELYNLFKEFSKETIIECLFDCCHAQDAVRMAFFDNRYYKPRFLKAKFMKSLEYKEKFLFGNKKKVTKPTLENVILFSACKSDQTSADAYIGKDYCGAFTDSLFKSMSKDKSREQIYKDTFNKVKSGGFSQQPQLECSDILKVKKLGEI